MRTFIIGDVHGHLDKLKALLVKSGATDADEIVQLGDIGQYDDLTRERDRDVWEFVTTQPNFKVLWGNHDAAVFSDEHRFRGYAYPLARTHRLMEKAEMYFALERHGFLLTHAGLSPGWAAMLTTMSDSPIAITLEALCHDWDYPCAVRDSISRARGGYDQEGGILWRDERERLADVPQIFGHSRADDIRKRGTGICIDVNAKEGTNLAGIWLPEMKVVAIGGDANFLERSLDDQADTH